MFFGGMHSHTLETVNFVIAVGDNDKGKQYKVNIASLCKTKLVFLVYSIIHEKMFHITFFVQMNIYMFVCCVCLFWCVCGGVYDGTQQLPSNGVTRPKDIT